MTITRINPIGLEFQLTAAEGKTIAVLQGRKVKTVLLDMTLDRVSQAWYNWQVKGDYIQVAFRDLPSEQREFLISGITPKEWEDAFGGENEGED